MCQTRLMWQRHWAKHNPPRQLGECLWWLTSVWLHLNIIVAHMFDVIPFWRCQAHAITLFPGQTCLLEKMACPRWFPLLTQSINIGLCYKKSDKKSYEQFTSRHYSTSIMLASSFAERRGLLYCAVRLNLQEKEKGQARNETQSLFFLT